MPQLFNMDSCRKTVDVKPYLPITTNRNESKMYDYSDDNLNIQNSCHACMLLDTTCQDCTDDKDSKLTNRAWELVDEGNLQYRLTLTYAEKEPSNHDWTDRDGEFKPPIVQLVDGMSEELAMGLSELWELDDMTQARREVQCRWCNLMTPKIFNDCQDCDKPLEHNVSMSLMNEIERFVK